MDDLAGLAQQHGIASKGVRLLSDRATRIVELMGAGVVARIHKPVDGEQHDSGFLRLESERSTALRLLQYGAMVSEPVTDVGVLAFENTSLSFWKKESLQKASVTGIELANALVDLESAFSRAQPPVRTLPTWELAIGSAKKARESNDGRLQSIANAYWRLDAEIRQGPLVGAHGDAHPGNLLKTERGWVWFDLEDVGLMPRYWDVATAVARSVLLDWDVDVSVEALRHYEQLVPNQMDWPQFMKSLTARCIQITLLCWEFAEELDDLQNTERRIAGAAWILSEPDQVERLLGIQSSS